MASRMTVALAIVIMAITVQSGLAAEKDSEYVRVYVYKEGTKPSVSGGRYEWRRVSKGTASVDSTLTCDDCMIKIGGPSATKPSIPERHEAFLCTHCQKLVWLEKGKEVKFTGSEQEACKLICAELQKPKAAGEVISGKSTIDSYHGTKPAVHDKVHKE